MIVFAVALMSSACTINRHYHTGPEQAYGPDAEQGQAQAYNTLAPDSSNAPGADQPIPPSYARPGYAPAPSPSPRYARPTYRDSNSDRGYDDGYYSTNSSYERGYARGYDDGYSDSQSQCARTRYRRHAPIRRAPIRRAPVAPRPRPVIPDNPVEWLE